MNVKRSGRSASSSAGGGAVSAQGVPRCSDAGSAAANRDAPLSTHTELAQLRIRVVALENLVITLLADAAQRQRGLAREMASYISPRPGFTAHPVTLNAAAQMLHLVERADHFYEVTPRA